MQCVPHLAPRRKELFVFQRTPSSVDVRANAPIDPDWFEGIATPGWQQRWLENFTDNQAGGAADEDLVMDGWTDLSRRIRAKIMDLPRDQTTPQAMLAAYEDSDNEKMDEIRARAETIVKDRETAEKLKAWYRQLCKRPCFHDEYLQAFNAPGAHLIDSTAKGVEKITEKGVVVGGKEYEVDCIIYASGFEVGTEFTRRAGFDLTGRDGVKLSEAWAEGMRTKHGIHVHGFPEPLLRAADARREPDLQRAAQSYGSGQNDRHDHPAAQDRGAQGSGSHGARHKSLGRSSAHGPGPHDDRFARLHARLLQQRRPGSGTGRALQCRLSRRRVGLFQIYRPLAAFGRIRRVGVSIKFGRRHQTKRIYHRGTEAVRRRR